MLTFLFRCADRYLSLFFMALQMNRLRENALPRALVNRLLRSRTRARSLDQEISSLLHTLGLNRSDANLADSLRETVGSELEKLLHDERVFHRYAGRTLQ